MNNVSLVGRLTRDIEVKNTISGTAVTKNCLAVKRDYKNANGEYDSDFINIVAFGHSANFINKYTTKGSLIGIVGKIVTGSYDDKDGKKVYTTEIMINNITLLEKKKEGGETAEETPANTNNSYDPFEDFGDTVELDDNFLD